MRLDHTQAPLVDAVRAYREADTLPFTTPGHKRGTGIAPDAAAALGLDAFRNDLPLGAGIDDSHFSDDLLGRAERLAADAFGADCSFFLVNGSSIGNQAAILALATAGEEIVVARNAHTSVLAALILDGARPVYVQPRYDPDLEVAHGVEVADLAATLDAHPRARAVVLTSPSYFGVVSDLPRLAALCHERGLPLHVDEAWAAHFPFHPDLPSSAIQAGADSAVTSIHKLLTGFGQSALLNVRGDLVDPVAVSRWLRLLQTTSPSALILASIDASRRQMALEGRALLDRTLALGAMARARIGTLPGIRVLGAEVLGRPGAVAFDPTKLVIDVAGTGHTGYWVEAWLRTEHRITVEMSDHRRVVALLSIADTEASVERLLAALAALAALPATTPRLPGCHPAVPLELVVGMEAEVVLTPAAAYRSPARFVPLGDAAGEIGTEALTPYPPGIPLLVPGERITPQIVAYCRRGWRQGCTSPGQATLPWLRSEWPAASMWHTRRATWLRAVALALFSLSSLCAALAAYVGWRLAHPERSYADSDPDAAGLAFEEVRFVSQAGHVPLRGWFLPSGASARTIIIAHGYNNHRLGEVASLPLAAALIEHGYNVLAFDFRASGHSGGDLVSLGQYERFDLLGALDYLDRRFAGRAHRVGLVGYSMGAVAALEAAALAGQRLGAVVSDSAFADMGAYLQGNLSKWSNLPAFPFNRLIIWLTPPFTGIDPRTIRPLASVRELTMPLLFIHGTADILVPYQDSVDLYHAAASADKALWLVPEAGHTTAYAVRPDAYVRRVLAFLDRAVIANDTAI